MNSYELAEKLLSMPCADIFHNDTECDNTAITRIVTIFRDAEGNAHTEDDLDRMIAEVANLDTTNTRADYDALITDIKTSPDQEYIDGMLKDFETFEKYRAIFITAAERSKKTIAECTASDASYLLMGD